MDDVAREAGFTKPILYQYFPSKIELYRELVAATGAALLEQLADATRGVTDGPTLVERAFRVYFEMVVAEPDAFRILFIHSHEGDTQGDLRAVELGLVNFIEPLFTEEFKADHRSQLAAGIVGIAEGMAVSWLLQQERLGWPATDAGTAERLAKRGADLAWGGLRSVHSD
jgi:AcrR family transcriptional regulator